MFKFIKRQVVDNSEKKTRALLDLIFSLAMALKVTPKRLAKATEDEKIVKFAKDYVEENKKIVELDIKKVMKQLSKSVKGEVKGKKK